MSIVRLLVIIFSILSIFSLLTIIIAFLFFTQRNNIKFELVFYLSISSLIATITYIMNWKENDEITNNNESTPNNTVICQIQGTCMTIAEISLYFWTTIIGFDVYKKVVKNEDISHSQNKRRIIYLFIGYFIPIVFGVVCLVTGNINQSGNYCWIIGQSSLGSAMRLIAFIMGYLSNFLNLFFAFSIAKMFYFDGVAKELGHHLSKGVIWKMIRYPVIQIISYLPSTINRVIELFEKEGEEKHSKLFGDIGIIVMSLLGFIITIAYGINTGTLLCIRNFFRGKRSNSIRIANDLLIYDDIENEENEEIEVESKE